MSKRFFLAATVIFVATALFLFAPVTMPSLWGWGEYYSDSHPILNEIRARFSRINPKYGNIPLKIGDKAYTEDKSVITLCIVDPHTKKFYDINTLMYVGLHELSHTLTKADGDESHGDEFKNNFAKLLKEAQARGVYNGNLPVPVSYCGTGS